ncbi:universal stress protein [Streptomyces sp. MAD19A]|uniref:universal stress protein n=1 Tax=Streptomyces TaxID=1883 RepID=UPI003529780F
MVGVDPDPEKRPALSWAADEAERRRLPLRLVHAQGTPTGGYRPGEVRPSWEEWNRELHGLGDQVLKDAVDFVDPRQPRVELTTLWPRENPRKSCARRHATPRSWWSAPGT